jgi:transposase
MCQLASLGSITGCPWPHRTVRLIPPQYVKPTYVKPSSANNDRNDAEAICEAAGHRGMRFVPVNSTVQRAEGMVLKVCETLVCQ